MSFFPYNSASVRHFAEFIPDITLVVQNNTTYTDIIEVFTDDTGEEPAFYAPIVPDQAQLIWALPVSIIIIDGSIRTFADWGDGPDYNPPIDVDNAVIVGTILLQTTLIVDMPMRSFGDVGDTGDYDPYNDESAAITLITGFNPALVILDYSPDPWNDDDTSDSSEYDFRDDTAILFTVYTELFVENDYTEFEVIEDTEGDLYPDFSVDLSWYFSPQTLLIFNDYIPLEGETLIEDSEGDYYPDFSIDLSFFLPIVTESFIFNDYTEFEVIEDTEGDTYPDFGIDLSWYLSPQVLLIFNDYVPLDNEELIEESEGDYYPDFSTDITWFLPIVTEVFIFNDYSPTDTDQLLDDTGEEQAWYAPQDELLSWFIPPPATAYLVFIDYADYLELYTDDSGDSGEYDLPFEELLQWFIPPLVVSYLIFNDYEPWEAETLTEESEGDYYPDFSTDITWFLPIVTEVFVFNDYVPSDNEQLIEDSESDFYPDFSIDLSWYFVQVFPLISALFFEEYIPWDTEQLIEDDGSDQSWYPPIDVDSGVIPFVIYTELFVENDYAIDDLESYDENIGFSSPSSYSLIFGANENFIFNDYSPDPWADDDTADGSEYDPLYDNVEAWYSTLSPLIVENPFIDYLELYTDDSSDSGEYDLPFEELLQWFIPPAAVAYLVFNEYIPLDTEQLIEDTGEGDVYPDFSIDLSWYFAPSTLLIFNDYVPWETETLLEESEGDYYPDFSVDLSSFLPIVTENFIFNEYVPLDNEELIEESEGDYYPDFSIDLSFFLPIVTELFVFNDYNPLELEQLTEDLGDGTWYDPFWDDSAILFSQNLFPINALEFEWRAIDTPEMEQEDQGDEDTWYGPSGSIDWIITFFVPPIPIENLIGADQMSSFAVPDPYLQDDEGDDTFYDPIYDADEVTFFIIPAGINNLVFSDYSPDDFDSYDETIGFQSSTSTYAIVFGANENFIFNDYTPLDNEELIEESEGDYYPDSSIDLSFFLPIVTENFIFNDYSPLEAETLIEDSEGDYYPDFSIDISWIFSTPAPQFIINDYTEFEVTEDTEGDYYPDFSIDLTWIFSAISPQFVITDYTEFEAEESEGDYYPDFGIDLAWYLTATALPLVIIDYSPDDFDSYDESIGFTSPASYSLIFGVNENFIFNDYVPTDNEELIEDAEGDYYPDFSIDVSWYFSVIPSQLVFTDYVEFESEESEGDYYAPIETDGTLISHTIVTVLFVENDYAPLELEQLTEESEGDYYPDFSIDLTWYIAQPAYPASLIFNDYSPLDYDSYVEDDGSEESWHHGLFYLGITISYTEYMVLYFPVYETIALYTPLTETIPGTEQQILVLYFPLQGTSSGGNLVGTG